MEINLYELLDHIPYYGDLATWMKPVPVIALVALGATLFLLSLYFLLKLVAPKIAAISRTTLKESLLSPFFGVTLAIGVFLLLLFPFIPYNTFGEDIKELKTNGLQLMMILSVGLALFTASVSISNELEGRTALMLLSKPVGRRQFVLGKFLGVIGPVAIMFIILGALFMATVSYKVVYDAREMGMQPPVQQACFDAVWSILPGLALALMEAVVLSSIAVALSTRLAMLPNLLVCISIYALGHLVPTLASAGEGAFGLVSWMGGFLATILPGLNYFNIHSAIAQGKTVPLVYLAYALLFCILYSSVAMLVALLMFEDRDLA